MLIHIVFPSGVNAIPVISQLRDPVVAASPGQFQFMQPGKKSHGRHITINATAGVAALLGEIGIPQKIVRGIAIVSRSAGLVGHILEESRKPSAAFIRETVEEAIPYVPE